MLSLWKSRQFIQRRHWKIFSARYFKKRKIRGRTFEKSGLRRNGRALFGFVAGAAAASVAARPQTVRRGLPELRLLSALFGEGADVLGHLHIRGVRAGLFNHGGQRAGVIEQRAGAQQIVAEGLAVAVGHEQR